MPNKRPTKKGKPSVPGAVKAIYAVMIVLVLAICGLVFWYTFTQTRGGDPDSGSSDTPTNSSASNNSVDSNDPESSQPDESSEPDESSDSESSQPDGSSESENSENSENSGSGNASGTSNPGGFTYNTDYSEEFFKDDLFIGDSIFTGLSLYGYIPYANVAAQIGYTPYKALNNSFSNTYSGSAADYAKERQPKRIFLLLGSNALAAGADAISASYSDLVKQLQADCPNSEICVISLTPVNNDKLSSDYSAITNPQIEAVNNQLKVMCTQLGVEYYDFNSRVKDENGNFRDELSEADGLHFRGTTYAVLLSELQTFMG